MDPIVHTETERCDKKPPYHIRSVTAEFANLSVRQPPPHVQ